jgi:hypothetical protein
VPEGFMPSVDRPFSVSIFRAGFLAPPLLHQGSQHDSQATEHCVFGFAGAVGPTACAPAPRRAAYVWRTLPGDSAPATLPVRLVHLPQPRGPPVAA